LNLAVSSFRIVPQTGSLGISWSYGECAFCLLSLVIKKRKKCANRVKTLRIILISSWWSSLRIAFSAVYRSASVGFERNFAFLSTVCTDCLVRLAFVHFLFSTPLCLRVQKRFLHVSVGGKCCFKPIHSRGQFDESLRIVKHLFRNRGVRSDRRSGHFFYCGSSQGFYLVELGQFSVAYKSY